MNTMIFPNNIRGVQKMNLVNEGESNKILICVEYHNRYGDSDCDGYFYDTDSKQLFTDGWTTRAYCTDRFFNEPCVDINTVSPALQQEVIEAVRKLAVEKQSRVRNRVTNYFWDKYPKRYSTKTRNEVIKKVNLGVEHYINNTNDLPVLVSFVYDDYDGYDVKSIFERWANNEEKETGIIVNIKK